MEHVALEERVARFRPRAASNWLLWSILAFLVIFVIWAALTELDRTVRGQGRVVPSSRLQVVSNLEGGIVAEILARAGQAVRAGETLIRLDPTQSSAELGSSSITAAALAAKVARLEAEVAGREPVYPAAAGEDVAIERSLHAARMAELGSLTAAARARIGQAERAVAEARANAAARASARSAAASERDMIRPLVERGIEPRLSLVRAENAAQVSAEEAIAADAAISRAIAAVAEARAAAAQTRQDWRARAATELATAQAEYSARRRANPALADRVARTTVRAPVAGRINRVLVTTVGGTVAPGAPLVELVPAREQLQIEAAIDPKDIASVRIDQPAKVELTAYDPAVYGSLEGRVVTISPDAVVDEETGDSHYIVRIVTGRDALTDKAGKRLPIGPGMIATVSLLGDKRSVLNYIFSPLTRLGQRAFRE